MRLSSQANEDPMWRAKDTDETELDKPEEETAWQGSRTWLEFADKSGLGQTAVGAIFTAVITSLPELVTSITAVHQGALTTAVGGIIGGNAFDVLFLALSNIAYRGVSIYHAMTDGHVFIIAISIIITGILLLGLLRREKHGFAGIGFESALILTIYVGAVWMLL